MHAAHVCQLRVDLAAGLLVGLRAKACQAFAAYPDLEWLQRGDKDIDAEVELEPVQEHGVFDILLYDNFAVRRDGAQT